MAGCRCDIGSLRRPPLQAGKNEIAIAVATQFYGWGIKMEVTDLKGIKLAERESLLAAQNNARERSLTTNHPWSTISMKLLPLARLPTDSKAKSWLSLLHGRSFWTALGIVFALPSIASGTMAHHRGFSPPGHGGHGVCSRR